MHTHLHNDRGAPGFGGDEEEEAMNTVMSQVKEISLRSDSDSSRRNVYVSGHCRLYELSASAFAAA